MAARYASDIINSYIAGRSSRLDAFKCPKDPDLRFQPKLQGPGGLSAVESRDTLEFWDFWNTDPLLPTLGDRAPVPGIGDARHGDR